MVLHLPHAKLTKIKALGQTVQPGEHRQIDTWMDGRYQMHYLHALPKLRGRKKLAKTNEVRKM